MFESKLFGQISGMGGYDFGEPVGHIDPLDHYRRNLNRMSGDRPVESRQSEVPADKIMPQYEAKQTREVTFDRAIWREFFAKPLDEKLKLSHGGDCWSVWVMKELRRV